MDHPLTLTKEQLEAVAQALQHQTSVVLSGVPVDDQVTYDVNDALATKGIEGPCVIMDIANPNGMNPGHLAGMLNSYSNDITDIAEESKKSREAIEMGLTDIGHKLDMVANAITGTATTSSMFMLEIRDALRSIGDAALLAQPLAPMEKDERLDAAADRILEALRRRPDLEQVVRGKLNGH